MSYRLFLSGRRGVSRLGIAALALGLLAVGCDDAPGNLDLEMRNMRLLAPPPGKDIAAGYLEIANEGQVADRLTGAVSEAARSVEIHDMHGDAHGGMRPVPDGIPIPVGETVSLAPGGLHLMLIGLNRELSPGDIVDVTLSFAEAGDIGPIPMQVVE